MSHEPSHRKPPRQERWPNATPGEGWPAYQQGDGEPPWESAPAYAGSRNGHGAASDGHRTAANGHGDAWGRGTSRGTTSNGYGDAWGGRDTARYSDPGQGYWAGGNGYGGTTTAYPAVGEGYADGFDGAADGYVDGYGGAADGHSADGYDAAEDYYEAPNGWDGYSQPGHEFTGSASYPPQDEYPALDPASSVLVAPDTMGQWWRHAQADRGDGPGHRGPIVGAMMGILAAAVAIGVATLAAAFVRPQAAPASAVSGVFLDRIPATLKHHLMAHFGAHGQAVLLLGAIGLVAIVLGFMARRNVSVGVAGLAAFGLLGAFVAITRPESRASDVIPSAIGGLAGIVALLWLARASAPAATLRPAYGNGRRRATMTTTIDRRKFVAAAAGTAVTAAVAGVGGELLIRKRFRALTPVASPPVRKVTPPRIVKQKPLPAEDSLNIPGLSPFFTPNAQFYRVDTSLTIPQVSAATWQLRIHGMVDNPMTITFDQLSQLPMTEHDVTLTCVSEAVGGGYIGNARWQGTLLAPLLRKAGIQAGADQIVMRDVNNMTIGVATDPVMDGRESLLAVGMNGQPLPAAHGYPVRVVVPGLYGYVSATKWVVDMELTTFGAFDAYWVKQGWSQQGPIKTESRIDVPKAKASLAAGRVTIAGVAWAQHKGIEAVEVSVDGTWYNATMAAQDTIDTWRQWYYVWDAIPGQHVLQVRATDKAGYTQTAVVHRTEPNGATGYHTIQVNVT